MNRILIFQIFIFSFLSLEAQQTGTKPLPLANTEAELSSVVAGCVNVITGNYFDYAQDMILPGSETLTLERSYFGSTYLITSMKHGWQHNHDSYSLIWKDANKNLVARYSEPSGSTTFYEEGGKKSDSVNLKFNRGVNKRGLTNCGSPLIGGQSNLKNHSLNYDSAKKRLSVSTGSGCKRVYHRHPKDDTTYQIENETRPNGNLIQYVYDAKGLLNEVKTVNASNRATFNKLQFKTLDPKAFETNPTLEVIANDGRRVTYRFTKIVPTKDEKKKVGAYERYLLTDVQSPSYKYGYQYKKISEGFYDVLIKKTGELGSFLEIDYFLNEKNKGINGRVKELRAPVGNSDAPIVTHRFTYNLKQDTYGFLTAPSSTDVFDALNHKTTYHFSIEERLTAIDRYKGTGTYQLYSKDRFFWANETSSDYTNLISRAFEDEKGTPLRCRTFQYDDSGNVLEERFYGNLSGFNACPLKLQTTGIPVENGCEYQKVTFTYSKDGMNLVTLRQDLNKTESYTYKSGTNLRTATLTSVKEQIVKREFCTYNDDAVLTCKIVDDGSNNNPKDITNVTERHITYITPRTKSPIGLPEIVEERYLDISTNEERLLKRVINTHSTEGWLLKQEVYDSNNQYAYALEWAYNAQGKVIMEKDALGQITRRDYDRNGNLIFEQPPRQDMCKKYVYDTACRLIRAEEKFTNGECLTTSYRYDNLGRKIASKDIYGNETKFTYDEFGQVVKSIPPPIYDENGNVINSSISTKYDALGNISAIEDGNGIVTTKNHTILGKPYEIKYPDGTSEVFIYNTEGTLIKSVAKNGSYTLYEHDYQERFTRKSVFSASGELLAITSATYNAFHVLTETDAAGNVTLYHYDGAGRQVKVVKNDAETLYVYDSLGRQIECHERFGEGEDDYIIKVQQYDLLNRVIEETVQSSLGVVFQKSGYGYDEDGNRNTVITYNQSGTNILTTKYDAHKIPILVTDALGNTTRTLISYNHCNTYGQIVPFHEVIDPQGIRTITIQNSAGKPHVSMRKNTLGEIIQKSESFYDGVGNLCHRIETVYTPGSESRQVITQWTYDTSKRIISLVDAMGTSEEKRTKYTYNAAGEKDSIIKVDGVVIKHTYDSLGRLHTLCSSDDSVHYVYAYDQLNNPIKVDDLIHHVSTSRIYDRNNRLIQENLANDLSIGYQNDMLGRPTLIVLPDGSSQQTTYCSNHISKMRRLTKENVEVYTHRYVHHDLSSNITEAHLAFGVGVLKIDYDILGRPKNIKAPQWNESLSYDTVGNLTQRTLADSQGTVDCDYSYDNLYQLQSESGAANNEYQNDSLYNRVSKNNNPSKINSLNQLLSDSESSFTYDLNGNMVKQTGSRNIECSYDALDRLTTVKTHEGTFHYLYDFENRRLSKTSTSFGTIRYFYIGNCEIGSCDEDGRIIEYRLLGQGKGAEISAAVAIELLGNIFVPLHDAQGNVVCLLDSSGKQVANYRYSAFGEERSDGIYAEMNPWRFSSKRFDDETGFVFFGRRYYSTTTGRWVTPDPIGYDDGPNLYAYVLNAPLTHFDLYGLWGEITPPNAGPHSGLPMISMYVPELIAQSIFKPVTRSTHEPIVTTNREFLNSSISAKGAYMGYTGYSSQRDRGMGFTNGIDNTSFYAAGSNAMLSKMANNNRSDLVYNPTNGVSFDSLRYICTSRSFFANQAVFLLHQMWDNFFSNSNPDARFLQFFHSEGAVNVRNALMTYDEARRKQIDLVGISPSVYIEKKYCGSVHHYVSKRDFVPLIDQRGKSLCADTIHVLRPHKDACWYLDHDFRSPTFRDHIQIHIDKHYNINSSAGLKR